MINKGNVTSYIPSYLYYYKRIIVIFEYREENESTKERLTNLERRCRELLLYQGAAISSASVALSGLSSRFEQLLDQLFTLYSISDADLQVSICRVIQWEAKKIQKKNGTH